MDKVYLVMEYVEHDLKALIDQLRERGKKFTTGQIKTLTLQLLSGLSFMHDNWMIHRDLKTSNLLLSHKGILKVCICFFVSKKCCEFLNFSDW